jgi:hypothetical protein
MLTPTQKLAIRKSITSFCLTAETNRLRWSYVEQRPFHGFGVPPDQPHIADCSAYVSLVFNWAMHQTKIYLADPLNEHYSGYGNTDTQYAFVKTHPAPVGAYLVGDMAIFGTPWHTIHTAICRKAGTAATAILSSNGRGSTIFNQDAPEPITVANASAAQPLVGIFRHPALL